MRKGKLPKLFYQRADVLLIAEELLGKLLVTNFDGQVTSGRIVECEAYAGINDRASHAYGGRRSNRVLPMYEAGGIAYVYLCYGIHHLFNVVTNVQGIPHAVLIRGLIPVEGLEIMQQRTGVADIRKIANGPGKLSKALGIHTRHSGNTLQGPEICLLDDGFRFSKKEIKRSARIGVDYAGEDAKLLYRYWVNVEENVTMC